MRWMVMAFCCLAIVLTTTVGSRAFDPADVGKLMNNNHCEGCNLSGVDLSKAELSGAGLTAADLSNANLKGTILLGAVLNDANLKGANLSGAFLDDAQFGGADLAGAKLGGARLDGADLGTAIGLTQAQLNHACADASGAPFTTKLPKGLTIRPCR